jgi:hypothetical protein
MQTGSATDNPTENVDIYFCDFFEVDPDDLEAHGAFNVSVLNDLPLFIDPFLLFNSKKPAYQGLHEEMIRYLRFLREKATSGTLDSGLIKAWFTFPEVKQNWLGFSKDGNTGSGLGSAFASALYANLNTVFKSFGDETVTRGSHLEKLTLIRAGVGKDNISDFTTNLIKRYLLEYTQTFANSSIRPELCRRYTVSKVSFKETLNKPCLRGSKCSARSLRAFGFCFSRSSAVLADRSSVATSLPG